MTQNDAFFAAWRHAIKATGCRSLFGVSSHDGAAGPAPKIPEIKRAIHALPKRRAVMIAAMVSLYNAEAGAALMSKVGVIGLGNLAMALDQDDRRLIVDLFFLYEGWK